jgi:hypothetical protein
MDYNHLRKRANPMTENPISQFQGKKYIAIETYRKSGEPVKTPVWFVEDNGALFVNTGASSGKVKRLRRNSQSKVVPCSMGGNPQGTWVAAVAEFVTDEQQSAKIDALLKKKYGFQKALLDLFGSRDKSASVTLKLQLAG